MYHTEPKPARRPADQLPQSRAVDIAVVQDRHAAARAVAHSGRERGALDAVVRGDAEVVPAPGRVVLVRLAGIGSRSAPGQPDRGVGGADLNEARVVED